MTTIYYWSGLSEANLPILSEYPEYRGKILQLLQGETRGADLDLKRHGDYPLYTIRLNDADRLLFTTVERDGKQYILLLEVIKNHDYQKSRFLKSGVLRRYIDAHEDEISSVIGTASFIAGEASEVPVGVESSASEVSPSPMMHYQDKWLTLDNSQAAASNTRDYPLLVSGPPGSGKSCIALSLLIKAMQSRESMTYKSMLCVTESKHVARHLSAQWADFPEALDDDGNLREDVRFLTYKELLCEMCHVEESQLVDKEYFEHWYADYRSGMKRSASRGKRSAECPLSDVDLVYQECRIVSGCDDLNGYLGLGRSQSLFEDADRRTRLWEVYQSYQSHLLERGLIAPDFHELPNAAHFGQVVVDEAQDLSIRQLMNLHGLVDGDRIACAMDSNQNLMSRVPIGLLFQQYCYRRGLRLQESFLEGTYRCPADVVSLSNGVLAVKNAVMGGATAQGELTSIHPATSETGDGEVFWESPPVDAETFRSRLSELLKEHNFKGPDIAIITPAATVEHVKRLSGSALVFTPKDIKGLEYPCIVAYNPLDYEALRDASQLLPGVEEGPLAVSRNRPKDRTGEVLHSAPYFNEVFVTFTRATQVLVVFQAERHPLRQLLGHLKTYLPGVVSAPESAKDSSSDDASPTSAPETTLEDWKVEVRRLHANGNAEQARAVHGQYLQDALNQSFEEFVSESSVEAVSSKPKAAEAAVAAATTPPPPPSPKKPAGKGRKKKKRSGRGRGRRSAPASTQTSSRETAATPPASASASTELALTLLQEALRLPDGPGRNGLALLKALCTDKPAQVRMLIEIPKSPTLKAMFFNLASPYFGHNVELDGQHATVQYLPYLIMQIARYARFEVLWPDFSVHLTNEMLNDAAQGMPGIPDGSSVLYCLLKYQIALVFATWENLFRPGRINAETMCRPITAEGQDQGMTPLFHLARTPEGQAFVYQYWPYVNSLITSAALNAPVRGKGEYQGCSPLYSFCTHETGIEVMRTYWLDIRNKITLEGLNQLYMGKSGRFGSSALFSLTGFVSGQALIVNRWDDFKHLIRHDGLNTGVQFKTEDRNASAFYYLSMSEEGRQLLRDHWDDFLPHITPEGLNQPITRDEVKQGESALLMLIGAEKRREFFYQRWADLRPLVTAEGLCRAVTGKGPNQGKSPLYFLCSSESGLQLLFDNWVDFKDKLSAEAFNRPSEKSGMSPFYLMASFDLGLLCMEQHWQDIRSLVTAEGMNRPNIDKDDINEGESSLFFLCGLHTGIQIMMNHWDDVKRLITPEGLNRPITGNPKIKDLSPIYLLTISEAGRQLLFDNWQIFQELITAEGLNRIVSGEGPQYGMSTLFHLCNVAIGRDILLKNIFFLARIELSTLLHQMNLDGHTTCALTPLCVTSSGREILRILFSSGLVKFDTQSLQRLRTTLLTLTASPQANVGNKSLASCLLEPPTTPDLQPDTQAFFINTLKEMDIDAHHTRVSSDHLNMWTVSSDQSSDGSACAAAAASACGNGHKVAPT